MKKHISYLSVLQLLPLLFLLLILPLKVVFAQNSILSNGNFVKIAISKTGIHKITFADLQTWGLNPASINPKNIRLYGNQGGMLPQANATTRPTDLQENAILVVGEEDNVFNNDDYILFYAQDANKWEYNATTQLFEHEKNLYSDKNYYFITIASTAGTRLQTQANISGGTQSINTYDERIFHEIDKFNLLQLATQNGSGREWYGEVFSTTASYDFTENLTGIAPNTDLVFISMVASISSKNSNTNFSIKSGTQNIGNQLLNDTPLGRYNPQGTNKTDIFRVSTNNLSNFAVFPINYTFANNGNTAARGLLNYYRLQFKRNLALYETPNSAQTIFRSIQGLSTLIADFSVQNIDNNTSIWDISNPVLPQKQNFVLNGNTATFGANTSLNPLATPILPKEFIVFKGNTFPSPELVGAIPNQNIHSLSAPNLLIITTKDLKVQADRLAQFRRTNDALSVEVVVLEEIYNEFSSGRADVTALRDCAKLFFDKSPTTFKYLLLFGDASFDYKNLQGETNYRNKVPTYEARESLHPINSYSSDDYYGFLKATDGFWQESPTPDEYTMDIGVGRLPVATLAEAEAVVNKLIYYANQPKTYGKWRNKVAFVADDGDFNIHLSQADALANDVNNTYSFAADKIFVAAYDKQPNANGGQDSPKVKNLLTQAVEQGSLIVNYTGHGAEIGWAEEGILVLNDITSWRNLNNMPFFVTATCEFGRYDGGQYTSSGAELALLNANGGAIGLVATTRPVFSSSNFAVNSAFYMDNVFKPINGKMPRIGDVMRKTKNNSLLGTGNRNFTLLGDPSMRLAYPEDKVIIKKINDKDILITQDTIKALAKIKIEGEIQNFVGTLNADFNGTLDVVVYDKITVRSTLETPITTFKVRETKLFEGKATITNGKFMVEFVAPKDINYTFGMGRILFYAQNNALNGSPNRDANGGKNDILVGGSSPIVSNDDTPPVAELFMNDFSFKNGGLVSKNATFIAKLSDDNGINISDAGVGHSITAYLDDNQDNTFILNNFYTADLDTYKSGILRFPLYDLPVGAHTLTFKVWDTHNNSTEKTISFRVVEKGQLEIINVFSAPNPFNDSETAVFYFEHNRAGEDLEVSLEIVNLTGQKITTSQSTILASEARSKAFEWNGKNANGERIADGFYIYYITVKSILDGATAKKIGKIVKR